MIPSFRSIVRTAGAAAVLLGGAVGAHAQTVTGLSNWSVVLDPGHGGGASCGTGTAGCENTGVYGYSETEKVLAIGLELERLLLSTDIGGVWVTRRTNDTNPTLAERVRFANQTGAAYFHAIHSNAGAATARSLFVLWPQDPATMGEPPAAGGKRMAEIMGPMLGRSMRLPLTQGGAVGECSFYGVAECRSLATAPKASRNYVQSFTTMPSTLSEAGFHTNPTQNQRNMSAEWKRMEARTMFYSMLRFRDVTRPAARILMGIVSDLESGEPINGATVEFGSLRDTTDTYERLFRRFTSDPNLLRNGFYYLEDVPAGTMPLRVAAPGFVEATVDAAAVDTFFTIRDVGLVSMVPVSVVSATPDNDATNVRIIDPIVVTFNRPVTRATVEAAWSFAPADGGSAVTGTFAWASDNRQVTFKPAAALTPFTRYTLTLGATAASPYGYTLDGNGDGTAGDAFVRSFTTGPQDVAAPRIVAATPGNNATNLEQRPLLTVTFDEVVKPSSVDLGTVYLLRTSDQARISVTASLIDERDQSVLHVVPNQPLMPGAYHQLVIPAGLGDAFDNRTAGEMRVTYRIGAGGQSYSVIDGLGTDVTSNWWQPTQSGSTTQTSLVVDSTYIKVGAMGNPLTGSTASMELRYGWSSTATTSALIREYLGGGAPFSVGFDTINTTLEAYVFGDGGGSLFRFALDDKCGATHGSCAGMEVSEWTKVSWKGWRRVTWDLSTGTTARFIASSDGVLDGRLYIDSFQLGYDTGAEPYGRIYIDDLRLVRESAPVSSEGTPETPRALVLADVRPNPARGLTDVRFSLPEAGPARIVVFDALGRQVATLFDGSLSAGDHETRLDAAALAPGVYVLRLEAGRESRTARVVVTR